MTNEDQNVQSKAEEVAVDTIAVLEAARALHAEGNTEGAIDLIRDTLGNAAADEAVEAMAKAEVPQTEGPVTVEEATVM